MWQQWINSLLGLWIIVSAYTRFEYFTPGTNLTVVGIALVVLSVWSILDKKEMEYEDRELRYYREYHA